jgi:hypothetical protein
MAKTLMFVACLCSFSANCADFCAVRVLLTDSGGVPTSALVELLDSSGHLVQRSLAERGEAQFCDFDFGDHSISVGGTTCGQVLVPHVRVHFGVTQIFKVYVNRCAVGFELLDMCIGYFRVTAPSGKPLESVSAASEPVDIVLNTDRYGRAQILVPPNESRLFVLSKPGYTSERIELKCATPEYTERKVVLKPIEK